VSRRTRERFPWLFETRASPLSIAHRGASDYAFDNTLRSFELAAMVRADLWELDLRATRDDVLVVHHDPALRTSRGESVSIADADRATLARLSAEAGRPIPTFEAVIALSRRLGCGLYVHAKDGQALERAPLMLAAHGVSRAVISSFDAAALARLAEEGCAYPLAVLVPRRAEPLRLAERAGADIVHLCWAGVDAPWRELVTPELLERAGRRDLAVVLWHEERRAIVEELVRLPVFALCSNRPEMLKPYTAREHRPTEVVCRRGFHRLAPEHTPLAAEAAFGAGFDLVGASVRESRDGELVVIGDASVDRTTDGSGAVADMTLGELGRLDAGSVCHPYFAGTRIPTLEELLTLAAEHERGLCIDIESASIAAVRALVEKHGMTAACLFRSSDSARLRELRARSPDARIVCRRKDHGSLSATIASVEAAVVEFDAMADDLSEIDACRRAGRRSMVAYDGSDESRFRQILAHGPELVSLDDPMAFLNALTGARYARRDSLAEDDAPMS